MRERCGRDKSCLRGLDLRGLGRICHDPVRMVNAVEVLNIAALIGFASLHCGVGRMAGSWMLGIGLQAVNRWPSCFPGRSGPSASAAVLSGHYDIVQLWNKPLGSLVWGLLGTCLGRSTLAVSSSSSPGLWALLLDLKPGSADARIGWPGPLAPLSRRFRSILGSGPSSIGPTKRNA